MSVLVLSLRSVWHRRATAFLVIVVIALSLVLLLGVERLRSEARASLGRSISSTDLIVGARSGSLNLLLYSVFRIGNPTNNLSWQSYQEIARHPNVAWTIPLALGDSHRGFRLLGTNQDYFTHYRFGRSQPLEFAKGELFKEVYDVVLGADVAQSLAYDIDSAVVISHGMGEVSLLDHSDKPFKVVGILKKTGTPVDKSLHVSLEGIEAIHVDWEAGVPVPSQSLSAEETLKQNLTPTAISAFLLGVRSKPSIFQLQRTINDYAPEALLAILPGVVLQELWSLMSVAEQALLLVSALVALSALVAMLSSLLASLHERRREMAILRAVGARPQHIFALLCGEALLLALMGCGVGVVVFYLLLLGVGPGLEHHYGIFIRLTPLSLLEWLMIASILVAAILMSFFPAYRAYRQSLSDGLSMKL